MGGGVSAGTGAAVGVGDGRGVAVTAAGTGVSAAGEVCSPPQAARAPKTARNSRSIEAIPVPVCMPQNDFMERFSAPGTVASMIRPVTRLVFQFDSAGASGWLCSVGAPMAGAPMAKNILPGERT